MAITIDLIASSPEVLLMRGKASVSDVKGVVPEYALAQRRYWGKDAEAYLTNLEQLRLEMVRIAVRPTWVGVLNFQTRFPERMPQELRG